MGKKNSWKWETALQNWMDALVVPIVGTYVYEYENLPCNCFDDDISPIYIWLQWAQPGFCAQLSLGRDPWGEVGGRGRGEGFLIMACACSSWDLGILYSVSLSRYLPTLYALRPCRGFAIV